VALLEVDRVSKRFGGVQAVKDVSLRVERGTVKALIGPNGAGKTTLFDILSGFRAPDAGTVRFLDRRIEGRPPHQAAAMGLSRTFQNLKLFPHMTALENVMVGRHVRSRAGFVALDQVRTVDGERLGKKLGRLAPATIRDVHRVLQELCAE